MKIKYILLGLLSLPVFSHAKITDFNNMIAENMKEQKQLQETMRTNVEQAKGLVKDSKKHDRLVFIEKDKQIYNAPTKKALLAFRKEKKNYSASQKKQFERIANELNVSNE